MKTVFTKRITVLAVVVAGFIMILPVAMLAAPREASLESNKIILSTQEATRMMDAFDRVLTRAVRPDAPELGDMDFPPASLESEDLQAIRECCCILQRKFDDIIGDPCNPDDESIDFCDCTDEDTIDGSKASVISYLRTILRELRGIVGTADHCEPCPTISDLPADLVCPGDCGTNGISGGSPNPYGG